MALIKCPSCGATISNKAERCPHCSMQFTGAEHIYGNVYAVSNSISREYFITF